MLDTANRDGAAESRGEDVNYQRRLETQRRRMAKSQNASTPTFSTWLLSGPGAEAFEKGVLLPELVSLEVDRGCLRDDASVS
jgi:hypothetical protein